MTDNDGERRTIPLHDDDKTLIPHPHLSTENVQIVMGMLDKDGNQCPELAGLIINDDDGLVGALPDTPAAELGLEKCAELTGLKIDWRHIQQRHWNLRLLGALADLAAAPPGDVNGRQRWRTRPTKEK